ncbi:hypothetical protein DWV16_00350 [Anaerotruncus sp. AF02-27]|uniref:hypothetical protein n=1 Tax=Anaerotruncus sp. AF02-27 TaxID=2292191 RepID=UPI000E54DCDA|nr:hypothetical protein [Anaerotruncus sp. AF02-27]RGX56809.1 hypothetical protein DWV16_00350 [Anaerotruncus sp. AF02-27]
MPNHITNRLTIRAEGEQLEKILNATQSDSIGRGSIDFNKLIPMPESLNIEIGSKTDRAISVYLTALNPHSPNMGCEKMEYHQLLELRDRINGSDTFYKFQCEMSPEELSKVTQYCPLDEMLALSKTAVDNLFNTAASTGISGATKTGGRNGMPTDMTISVSPLGIMS